MNKPLSPSAFKAMVKARKLSRRTMLKTLASVGIATVTVPLVRRKAKAGSDDLVVFTWDVYAVPEMYGSYFETYGKAPEFSYFGDLQEAFIKLQTGYKPDVATTGFESIRRWRDGGVISPIDTSRLVHWPDVFDKLKGSGTLEDGIQWAVPFIWGSNSVVYRTDLAPEYRDNHTWEILWDPKYKGKIAMRDSADEAAVPAALVAGVADPFNMSDEDISKVRDRLAQQRELLRFYYSDNTTLAQSIAAGEVVAAYAWSDVYAELKAQGLPVAFMAPKEGILTWIDLSVLVTDAPAPDEMRYAYMDATLSPESGVYAIEEYAYGHANRKAFEQANLEVLEELGWLDPEAVVTAGVLLKPFAADTQEKVNRMFEEVKAGY
jgi:spermidine/putrescine transport system substrate-binding protein